MGDSFGFHYVCSTEWLVLRMPGFDWATLLGVMANEIPHDWGLQIRWGSLLKGEPERLTPEEKVILLEAYVRESFRLLHDQ